MQRDARAWASASAIAAPSPREEPVTSAVLPESWNWSSMDIVALSLEILS